MKGLKLFRHNSRRECLDDEIYDLLHRLKLMLPSDDDIISDIHVQARILLNGASLASLNRADEINNQIEALALRTL